MGGTLAGSGSQLGQLSGRYLDSLGLSKNDATIIGSSKKAPVRFAAFANAVGIHADDYDDTQLAVAPDRVYGLLTHPTAPCLPAALAVAEAWPVKAENTIATGKKVNKPANREILDHRAIAMEQHHAGSGGITTIEIMKSHTLALREGADRWVPPFSHD